MSNSTPSSFIHSKRFVARISTAKARFIDAQTGAELLVDKRLAKAAAELLGMSSTASADGDHHLIYVDGGRILHVAYAEAHERVYGPPVNCDDHTYTSWWIRHRAWRRGVVSAGAKSSNAEETLRFFAIGPESANNPYPTQHGAGTASPAAGARAGIAGLGTDVDQPGRVRLLCPSCKSADVLRDAYAKWSVDDQAWVLAEVFDHLVCETCQEGVGDLLVVHDDGPA